MEINFVGMEHFIYPNMKLISTTYYLQDADRNCTLLFKSKIKPIQYLMCLFVSAVW
jgi:hypothetical protein